MTGFAYVYITAMRPHGLTEMGLTRDLRLRAACVSSRRDGSGARLPLMRLVWFELHSCLDALAEREHQLRIGGHLGRGRLVARSNPEWRDLRHLIPETSPVARTG